MDAVKRAVIVAAKESYRTGDFVEAAALLRIDAIVATDAAPPLDGRQLRIDLSDPSAAAEVIGAVRPRPDAVVGIDDRGVVVAAEAARLLGLEHNSPDAVSATRDKLAMRNLLGRATVSQPAYRPAPPGEVRAAADLLTYPVVVKPTGLSASRGVIRADGPVQAERAEQRIRRILADAGRDAEEPLLVEEYLPGDEVAVEAVLVAGRLRVLAVIDKPDPLEGPYFEETLYVTPSRHPVQVVEQVTRLVEDAAHALGLHTGPVHAEARIVPRRGPVMVEIAARSIGGLCGRALTFGLPNEPLEVLILRSALGLPLLDTEQSKPSSGVLMLPIPATGTLTAVDGLDLARALEGIDDIAITVPVGRRIVALPEGDRYLGFVFASALDPAAVERALRLAGNTISVAVDGETIRPSVAAEAGTESPAV